MRRRHCSGVCLRLPRTNVIYEGIRTKSTNRPSSIISLYHGRPLSSHRPKWILITPLVNASVTGAVSCYNIHTLLTASAVSFIYDSAPPSYIYALRTRHHRGTHDIVVVIIFIIILIIIIIIVLIHDNYCYGITYYVI